MPEQANGRKVPEAMEQRIYAIRPLAWEVMADEASRRWLLTPGVSLGPEGGNGQARTPSPLGGPEA